MDVVCGDVINGFLKGIRTSIFPSVCTLRLVGNTCHLPMILVMRAKVTQL